jgi:hypothetical protein
LISILNPIFTIEGVKKTIFGAGALQEIGPEDAIPGMSDAAMKVERPILNNPRTRSVKVAEDIYSNAFHGNRTV